MKETLEKKGRKTTTAMIKRTLYFGNPAYLSMHNAQLVIHLPDAKGIEDHTGNNTIPIEDIGMVILDHKQITITHGLIEALLTNNTSIKTCDSSHMPVELLLPLSGNTIQSERFQNQIEASLPLQKQLWQQTIQAKISNQAYVLNTQRKAVVKNMLAWVDAVKTGDSDNLEARAAAYYWANLFPDIPDFRRGREGVPPNNLLNYGYAILRAVVARSLVASGLLPTLGIHHHNRYNAYCLADDIMEPYRPFIDKLVVEIIDSREDISELSKPIKAKLLNIPILDVTINNQRSPLMIAVGFSTASLAKCYAGEIRKIVYPVF